MSGMVEPLKIRGLRDVQRALRDVGPDAAKELRLSLNEAAEVVARAASAKVPRGPSGRAAASIKAASQQRAAIVRAGSAKAPYYGWLDFGGRTGRKRSVKRPFITEGRYLFPAIRRSSDQITRLVLLGLDKVMSRNGLA